MTSAFKAGLIASAGILALTTWIPAYAQQAAANEVIVYEDIDYTGAHNSWKLEPGMRQKLVTYVGDDLNDRISSMRIGSDVGVAAFYDASYRSACALFEFSESATPNPTDFDFQGFDNKISSLIIYPKPMKGPQGVFLGGTVAQLISFSGASVRFFPLPEILSQTSAKYPMLGPEWDKFFDFGMFSPEMKSAGPGGYVELALYEQPSFGGITITIPWRAPADVYPLFPLPSGEEGIFELANYDFAAKASSLEVRWVDTSHVRASAPPAPDTPQNPSDPSDRTPPAPGTQQPPADKTAPPSSSGGTGANISGQWNSNIGVVYTIQQNGSQFTWSAPSLNQSGAGTVSGDDVSMSGPGWTVRGKITERDPPGKPIKIVGENGVVLFR